MTPTLVQILAAIESALTANHGTGLDLSDPDRVIRGRYAIPPTVPCAAMSGPELDARPGEVMLRWTTSCAVDLVVWGQVSSYTLDTRVRAADAVLVAIVGALLTASRSPASALYALPDLNVVAASIDADFEGASEEAAQVALRISWTIHRSVP
jgi:hypothetical protein